MNPAHYLKRISDACAATGLGRTTFYKQVADGLLPPLVPISARAVAVPAGELEAVNKARIAGASDDEIRALVKRMHAARANLVA